MPTNHTKFNIQTETNATEFMYISTMTTQDERKEWGIVKKLRFYRKAVKWLWRHRAEDNNRHKWRRMMREVQE